MKKYTHFICIILVFILALSTLAGCSLKKDHVKLTLWVSEEEEEFVKKAVKKFEDIHKKEADFDINIQHQNVDGVKKLILDSPSTSADIFEFASDQFGELKKADMLLPITYEKNKVMEECGGSTADVIKSVKQDDNIYAFPYTGGNGYFLFYNTKYFKPEDVNNMDRMLEIAAANGKYISMDWTSGWYLYSFFAAAGKDISYNEKTHKNDCSFNRQDGDFKGTDVINALLDISKNPGFKSIGSSDIIDNIKSGDVIAVVNGSWNSENIENVWKDGYAATKLPTYTVAGKQLQMRSLEGFKYMGINSHCKNSKWAMKIARWLSDYDHEKEHFDKVGECPANIKAAQSGDVYQSISINALKKQMQYADFRTIGENYWNPMSTLGSYLISGNNDNVDMQVLLDDTVDKICK